MKTQTVETPVQIIHGYVPLITVLDCPDWARDAAHGQHGSHDTLPDGRCMVLVIGYFGSQTPPGAWVITYSYSEEEGTHDHDLWVAARVR